MVLKLELLGAGLPDAVQPLGAESGALQNLENELADADRVGFHRRTRPRSHQNQLGFLQQSRSPLNRCVPPRTL